MTVAQAKKKIIAQIKQRRGLFENIGDKELRQLQSQNEFGWWDDKCEQLWQWITRLDANSIKQYL